MINRLCRFLPFLLLLIFSVGAIGISPAVADNLWTSVCQSLDDAGIDSNGFVELRTGRRLVDPVDEKHTSLAEARVQLELNVDFGWGMLRFKNDFLADPVTDDYLADLRELSLIFFHWILLMSRLAAKC